MDIAKLSSKFHASRYYGCLTVFALIISTLIVLHPCISVQAKSSASDMSPLPSLPSTANLTLVALNGTEIFLNSSKIAALPSTMAPGGYTAGTAPFSTYNYTGVSLKTLADLVGGLNSSEVLMVEGSDGYTKNFTYSQVVNGNFSTFNSTTGNPASPTKPIVPIVAYYNNSLLIPGESNGGSGPLMVAMVGNDNLVTQGKYWIKWVVKLEVLRASSTVPEFSPVSIVSLFIALTLIAVASIVWLGRRLPQKLLFNENDEDN